MRNRIKYSKSDYQMSVYSDLHNSQIIVRLNPQSSIVQLSEEKKPEIRYGS